MDDEVSHFLGGCLRDPGGQLVALMRSLATPDEAAALLGHLLTEAGADVHGGSVALASAEGRCLYASSEIAATLGFLAEAMGGVRVCEKYAGLLEGAGDRYPALVEASRRAGRSRAMADRLASLGISTGPPVGGERRVTIELPVGWAEFQDRPPCQRSP